MALKRISSGVEQIPVWQKNI